MTICDECGFDGDGVDLSSFTEAIDPAIWDVRRGPDQIRL